MLASATQAAAKAANPNAVPTKCSRLAVANRCGRGSRLTNAPAANSATNPAPNGNSAAH